LTQSIGVNPGFFFSGCQRQKIKPGYPLYPDFKKKYKENIERAMKPRPIGEERYRGAHKNYLHISHWNIFEMFHKYSSFFFCFGTCSPEES
jgi:hypothetical protein